MPLDEARVQDIRDGYESRIAGLQADLAASRALVAEKDRALACLEGIGLARLALALTEDEMRKRLEEK